LQYLGCFARTVPLALGAVALAIIASPARAGTFDPSGQFSFDPNAVARNGFDVAPSTTGVKLVRAGDAVEGSSYVNIDVTNSTSFQVTLPAADASYVARFFARSNRVVATIGVGYPNDGGSPSFSARFYPTGTVTSDGWYEVTTNAFSVQGSRTPTINLSINASGADVDAFEIVPQGTFKALAACSPPVDAACAPNEFCGAGWCRDGSAFVPPLPPPDERGQVIEYFKNRIQIFFGGRFSRVNYMPNAIATLDGLYNAPNPWVFWNGIITAVHRLHDWHTTVYGPVNIGGRGAFPICFVEGDGDVSHGLVAKDPNYYDVLVSHVGPTANSGLKAGDRLVAINGMHPIAFVESLDALDWGMWRADDPGTHAEAVERLASVIRRWATNITVVRCNPQSLTCSAPETIAVASLPPDSNNIQYPYCDHRPGYHLGQNGPDPVQHNSYNGPFHGLLADSQTGENIYGMVWNDVYLDGVSANPYEASIEEFRANANAVILDHRLGNGGTEPAASYLTELFRSPATLASWAGFHQTVGEYDSFSQGLGLMLYSNYLSVDAYNVGSTTAKTKMPTALMIARDGSASDWFPLGMKGGGANIRVFGRPTAGAFSSYLLFDYFSGFTFRLASGDLINPDGTTHLGSGIVPDEEIVPTQSDLLTGHDTVYEHALQWVRTCTACRQ